MYIIHAERNHDPELKSKLREYGIEISFVMRRLDFKQLFNMQEVKPDLPKYAPIHESIVCADCGEKTMGTRIITQDNLQLCLSCAKKSYGKLTGNGIVIL